MYSYIIENLQFCSDTEGFFAMYKELNKQYHKTYKDAKNIMDKANKLDEINKILEEIDKYEQIDENHPEIPKLYRKLRELKKYN